MWAGVLLAASWARDIYVAARVSERKTRRSVVCCFGVCWRGRGRAICALQRAQGAGNATKRCVLLAAKTYQGAGGEEGGAGAVVGGVGVGFGEGKRGGEHGGSPAVGGVGVEEGGGEGLDVVCEAGEEGGAIDSGCGCGCGCSGVLVVEKGEDVRRGGGGEVDGGGNGGLEEGGALGADLEAEAALGDAVPVVVCFVMCVCVLRIRGGKGYYY